MTIEIPQAEVRDYPGGLSAWTMMMARKLGACPVSVCAKNAQTGRTPKRHPSEHEEQALLIARVDALAEEVSELRWLFAIPNGGWRARKTAADLKAEGVRSGVPDLMLPVARGGYHGLYIEMKAQGGRTSDEQRRWHEALSQNGYRVEVCVGADAAWRVICEYLGIRG